MIILDKLLIHFVYKKLNEQISKTHYTVPNMKL